MIDAKTLAWLDQEDAHVARTTRSSGWRSSSRPTGTIGGRPSTRFPCSSSATTTRPGDSRGNRDSRNRSYSRDLGRCGLTRSRAGTGSGGDDVHVDVG
jgi:hypothetical protein